ncbi:phenylacetate-CoA oxygenase subunit PaaC [Photobacterium sp. BZF1]|uniref:1,2-phenylacetyl-CoA epoxidase subunit PaaC n=1 Tax=Photobacterium sp. BZF1 TaxID=1904457 RepID=UPI0016536C09|nr:1,2-phenylacetyl-CoA epoxidase subunit PaaC [Photobacterium sp. BZF1]MBC7001339.1 phenylacetate-CoA oxygenase subunit PaaC [Photobacterium sp. BZF1]
MVKDNPELHYALQLADTSLILSHRLSEWCGVAPELEIDMALANIGLDLLGEARNFYQYAAELEGAGRSEDDFAYFRDQSGYLNLLMVEQPNEGFDITLTRQFLFDVFHNLFLAELQKSTNPQFAAIAKKSIKEAAYHLRFSQGWMIRLGDGTDTSNQKIQSALTELWRFTEEMFTPSTQESVLVSSGIAVDVSELKAKWLQQVSEVLAEANLVVPDSGFSRQGGKQGQHSEHLGYILAEMQYMQRIYPNCQW